MLRTAGLSKAFELPGLRIGWLITPAKTIADCWSHKDYTTITPAGLSDRLAALAMTPRLRAKIFQRTRAILNTNLPALQEWVGKHDDRLELAPPEAGAIALLRYRLPLGSLALAEKLRVGHSVLIVAGDHCGLGKHIRIDYGSPREELFEGLSRIDRGLPGQSSRRPGRTEGPLVLRLRNQVNIEAVEAPGSQGTPKCSVPKAVRKRGVTSRAGMDRRPNVT